jgi:hypothetical protein
LRPAKERHSKKPSQYHKKRHTHFHGFAHRPISKDEKQGIDEDPTSKNRSYFSGGNLLTATDAQQQHFWGDRHRIWGKRTQLQGMSNIVRSYDTCKLQILQ